MNKSEALNTIHSSINIKNMGLNILRYFPEILDQSLQSMREELTQKISAKPKIFDYKNVNAALECIKAAYNTENHIHIVITTEEETGEELVQKILAWFLSQSAEPPEMIVFSKEKCLQKDTCPTAWGTFYVDIKIYNAITDIVKCIQDFEVINLGRGTIVHCGRCNCEIDLMGSTFFKFKNYYCTKCFNYYLISEAKRRIQNKDYVSPCNDIFGFQNERQNQKKKILVESSSERRIPNVKNNIFLQSLEESKLDRNNINIFLGTPEIPKKEVNTYLSVSTEILNFEESTRYCLMPNCQRKEEIQLLKLCGHSYCFVCLKEYILKEYNSGKMLNEIFCPAKHKGCIKSICESQIVDIIGQKKVDILKKRTLMIAQNKQEVKCPSCKLPLFVDKEESTTICMECNYSFCLICKEESHKGDCISNRKKIFEGLVKEKGIHILPCPYCYKFNQIKKSAPDLKICIRCRSTFCKFCACKGSPAKAHGPGYHRPHCRIFKNAKNKKFFEKMESSCYECRKANKLCQKPESLINDDIPPHLLFKESIF